MNLNVRIAPAASKRQGLKLRSPVTAGDGESLTKPDPVVSPTNSASVVQTAAAPTTPPFQVKDSCDKPRDIYQCCGLLPSQQTANIPRRLTTAGKSTRDASSRSANGVVAPWDDETQFFRCIYLLNLVVAEQLRAGGVSHDCGGFILQPHQRHGTWGSCNSETPSKTGGNSLAAELRERQLISSVSSSSCADAALSASPPPHRTSSKVTVLRRETRIARLACVLPLQLTVFCDAVAIADWNGPESHHLLLAGLEADATAASDGDGGCVEHNDDDDAAQIPEVYFSQGTTRRDRHLGDGEEALVRTQRLPARPRYDRQPREPTSGQTKGVRWSCS